MKRTKNTVGSAICALLALLGVVQLALSQSTEITLCQSRLKQYSMALLMYQQDYDWCFPPMKMPVHVQNRVFPYTKDRSLFKCRASGKDYLPNPSLGYLNQASIESLPKTMMLRDAAPHALDNGGPGWNIAH